METIGKKIIEALEGGLSAMQNGDPLRGWVCCRDCGRRKQVNATECMQSGWPKCCGCTMTIDLPSKDCAKCVHREEDWRDGGHCYMFREEPEGENCGQFEPRSN